MQPVSWSPSRLVCLTLLFAGPSTVSSQVLHRDQTAHVRYLGLNVAIGATASLARALVAGAPIRTAVARGLLGGSLMSSGMELIGTQRRSTRFAGLQVTALGASIARNADSRAPMFSDVTLPLYPFYVRLRPGTATPISARLSVMSAARLASVLSGGRRPAVDWSETLVTGAPVLASPRWRLPSSSCRPPCEGSFAQHNAGVIVYSASAGTDYDLDRSLAHESVHLAQQTRDAVLDAIPASDAAFERLGRGGRLLSRFIILDALMPLRLVDEGEAAMRGVRRYDSWYEVEARAFAPGGQLH